MPWEVDFLAVGEGEKSGDAIALRFGNLAGPREQQAVMVIDGGTKDSGESLVQHIQNCYETSIVDIVVSTHPDMDHASGLAPVLESLNVRRLLMHQPWNHADAIKNMFRDGRVTAAGLEERVWRALQAARDLETIATRRNIPIIEPFSDDFSAILGPSREFYRSQLARFRCMPDQLAKQAQARFLETLISPLKVVSRALESWSKETLSDPDEEIVSGENNTSVILLLDFGGERFLFTGDAGVPALREAVARAAQQGIDLQTVKYLQIPHHGSRRNVGPTILNAIVGPILLEGTPKTKTAFVSAAKDGAPKHPAKKVTNAFERRGVEVYATAGNALRQGSGAPPREGYSAAVPVPFFTGEDDSE